MFVGRNPPVFKGYGLRLLEGLIPIFAGRQSIDDNFRLAVQSKADNSAAFVNAACGRH